MLSSEDFRSIKAAYYRIALDSTEQYSYNAKISGLEYDRYHKESAIAVFAQSVMTAGETLHANPMELPFIPHWNRSHDAIPDICQQVLHMVNADS